MKMRDIYLDGYTVEPITLSNLSKYEDVFYCNNDYYMITDGRPATRQDCIDTVEYSMDEIPQDNILNIGFSHEGNAVACLFVIKGYPREDILYIGLFLVHNNYKRTSIGSQCIQAVIRSLKGTNIKYVRLSVQDNNTSGLPFWKHMGFSVIEKIHCGDFSNLTMEYAL